MLIRRAEFESAYPVLFHISRARDMEQIMRHGLLSTIALLVLCEIEGEFRSRIELHQRPKAISISHSVHGDFLINDQAPMNASALAKCLTDLAPQQWCHSLNSRVFSMAGTGTSHETQRRNDRGENQSHHFSLRYAISFRRTRC